ncbi:MAG TPA: rifamycin-inactivating phosphotransferase [Gemmatimonadaceae bacterium]|jgi:pyruvate,water dikinase
MRVVPEMNDSHGDDERTTRYVLHFEEIDQTQTALVGGKGANLGELSHVEGIRVPAGFCVTASAFRRIVADASSLDEQLDHLSQVNAQDQQTIRTVSAELRRTIEAITIPNDLASEITHALARVDANDAYAVRSSATAEDSPTTSFAGQLDSYLNVSGADAILRHISRCWASLFTERAVIYRARNGIDHRHAQMAVVIQQMVFPQTSGILFTADPISGNRNVISIDASFGLGEALVAGLVNPDVYQVRDGTIVTKTIAMKQLAIDALSGGGTRQHAIEAANQQAPALSDAQIIRLAHLGRQIEAHFERPQDIEWCLANNDFYIVQSRPITTLFPIPVVSDAEKHVYVSVGHQQMMTDAMKPLGISMWQLTAPSPMYSAGGRVFVDISRALSTSAGRAGLIGMLGRSEPLIRDALETIIERGFIPSVANVTPVVAPTAATTTPIETDANVVTELIASEQASIDTLKRDIQTKSGAELFDFIRTDLGARRQTSARSMQVVMGGIEATWWLNEHLEQWLGEKNAADVLAQSVPNNVTSEMGLALLQVADVIRPHAAVVTLLEHATDDGFLKELPDVEGGREALDAIQAWLDRYGMRGVGEIDVTRPRWSEHPSMLVPLILGNVKDFESSEGERRFDAGKTAAANKEGEVLAGLRARPDSDQKAAETKRMIDRLRTFMGYREYPKYFIVNRYFIYKQALLREAERLVQAKVLREKEDIFYLTFQEIENVVRTNVVDYDVIHERIDAFRVHQTLSPPRMLTSEGETISGIYRRNDFPKDALVGLGVSSGTVEGRARVIFDPTTADIEPGDIVVTPFTDPSWTPVFVRIKGLVTEVGGLMTHGAVIAREYGLPAVVGVERATRLIRDGERIRVDGTNGYIELLDPQCENAEDPTPMPRWLLF